MTATSASEYPAVLRRIKRIIDLSGLSTREIASRTAHLEAPETLHHSAMSQILGQKFNRRLSITHALVLSQILSVPPVALFYDFLTIEDARRADKLMRRFVKLPPDAQEFVLAAAAKPKATKSTT